MNIKKHLEITQCLWKNCTLQRYHGAKKKNTAYFSWNATPKKYYNKTIVGKRIQSKSNPLLGDIF